jgi:hypothetical protein
MSRAGKDLPHAETSGYLRFLDEFCNIYTRRMTNPCLAEARLTVERN